MNNKLGHAATNTSNVLHPTVYTRKPGVVYWLVDVAGKFEVHACRR